MRPWIEYLITNANAGADFIEWIHDIDVELKKKLTAAVIGNEIETARSLASEIDVYNTIGKKVKTEMRERASQIQQTNLNTSERR